MKNYHFRFTHSPLKNQLHLQEINKNAQLQEALHNNLTPTFDEDVEWRLENERNLNVQFDGEQGSGKSTGGRIVKGKCDRIQGIKPSIDDIAFSRRELLTIFKNSKRGRSLINDEDYDFQTQMGSLRVREQTEFIEQVIRAGQINLINCSVAPSPHLFNYYLRAFDIDYQYRVNRCLLLEKGVLGYYPAGFVLLESIYLDANLEKAYAKKKAEFIEKVKSFSNRNLYAELEEKANEIIEKFNFRKQQKVVYKLEARKNNPELSENELNEIADTCIYLNAVKRTKKSKPQTI